MTVQVEASETSITALLETVRQGDEVQLLSQGIPVATVVPGRSRETIEKAQAALRSMDERAKRLGLKFDMAEFLEDKAAGRK